MLASEGKADFIVTLAGMAISGKQTLMNQNLASLRSIGMQEEMVKKYSDVISDIFDKVAAGQDIDLYLNQPRFYICFVWKENGSRGF